MPEAYDLSPDQEAAFSKIINWYTNPNRNQFFKLFGYAGSGKTTLANTIAAELTGKTVFFCAYTGKAAQVLRRKTGRHATTIHQLIYSLKGQDEHGAPIFGLAEDSAAGKACLLVVDECSMINKEIMDDLLSWNVPVLALGDPAQLPPIKGEPFFQSYPDAMLESIHRQAEGNPILKMAQDIRNGIKVDRSPNDKVAWFKPGEDIPDDTLLNADQVLCGKNETRFKLNKWFREKQGYTLNQPMPGEKVVCLKNNHDLGIFNGETFTVVSCESKGLFGYRMRVVDERNNTHTVLADPRPFKGEQVQWSREYDLFDYGYALTVNKAQGSEWDNVILWDDKIRARDAAFRRQWLYTAVTRAADRLTVIS